MGRNLTRLERPITRLTVYLREGRPVIVRLTPDGLRFRRKYERRWYPLSWEQAWLLAQELRPGHLPFRWDSGPASPTG